MLANDFGSALYAPMASVVRAVGRIVVCVEAAAEERTERISRISSSCPIPESPKTVGPSAWNTSSEFSGLASPSPVSPVPANATVATLTMA